MTRGRKSAPVAVISVDRPRQLRARRAEADNPQAAARAGRAVSSFGLALLLAVSLAAVGWAFQSDAFRMRTMTISGASSGVRLAIEDMLAPGCAELQVGRIECGGSALGTNVLTVSTADMERQLAKQLPL